MPRTAEPADPKTLVGKEATEVQRVFADWIMEECEYDPASAKTKEQAFRDGVRLGKVLIMKFQASEANHALRGARKSKAADNGEAEAAPPAKAAKKAAAAKATKAAPAAKAATAPAARGRGRGRGRAAAATEEAPF